MTLMVLTLVLALFMLVVLAGALRRLGREEQFDRPREHVDPLDGSASADIYRPISRLFSTEDSAFLARFGDRGRKLTLRLGSARARVLRLYLRQMRADFGAVSRLARLIAPHSDDPNFAFWITKQSMLFHAVLAAVYIRSWLGWRLPVPLHAAGLVGSLDVLRDRVRAAGQQVHAAIPRTAVSKG